MNIKFEEDETKELDLDGALRMVEHTKAIRKYVDQVADEIIKDSGEEKFQKVNKALIELERLSSDFLQEINPS